MHIAISNSILSSSNSRSTPLPPPEFERYLVNDCVGICGNLVTIEYPYGTYQLNDRVLFNECSTFGYVLEAGVGEGDNISIYSVGVNSENCFDNSVNLTSINELGDNYLSFYINLNSINNFTSVNSEYEMYVQYTNSVFVLLSVSGGEGEPPYYDTIQVQFNGTANFANYNYEQGGDYEIVYRSEYFSTNETPIEYYYQNIYIVPYFQNINGYSSNPECSNYAFLRANGSQAGSTFNMGFRNDNC